MRKALLTALVVVLTLGIVSLGSPMSQLAAAQERELLATRFGPRLSGVLADAFDVNHQPQGVLSVDQKSAY